MSHQRRGHDAEINEGGAAAERWTASFELSPLPEACMTPHPDNYSTAMSSYNESHASTSPCPDTARALTATAAARPR